jgi:hypothetical protein
MTTTVASEIRSLLANIAAPALLGRDELLNALSVLGEAQAALDAVKLRVVGELVHRSTVVGEANPTTRAGHSQPAALVAERWQIALPAARQYCRVGEATAPRVSLAAEALPARFPTLAAALDAPAGEHDAERDAERGAGRDAERGAVRVAVPPGRVSLDQAAVIVRELDKAAPACSASALALGENTLVEHAPNLTVAELRVLAGHVRDRLDEDGILPRDELRRRRRSLTISTTADGMTHVDWYLDPESAGYVVTAIDAFVGGELRAVRFRSTEPDADAGDLPEPRSMAQLRSDAATDVFRHLAACTADAGDASDAAGRPPVTVVVRIGLDTLQSGVGTGEIDGIPTPISATTARRMAADARLIPAVLGGAGEVLDLGRSRRLFTRAQKLALAERDGGCAWTGCPHPPNYTETHHIRWWTAHHGQTDLDNGVLLCSSHHHRIHADGWEIRVPDGIPHFVPPAHIDPHRRPRRGGRIRMAERAA